MKWAKSRIVVLLNKFVMLLMILLELVYYHALSLELGRQVIDVLVIKRVMLSAMMDGLRLLRQIAVRHIL